MCSNSLILKLKRKRLKVRIRRRKIFFKRRVADLCGNIFRKVVRKYSKRIKFVFYKNTFNFS